MTGDAPTVSPDVYKVVAEDERVRVLSVRLAPGELTHLHTHPETVSIMQTGGTVRFTDPTGQTQEVTLSAGEPVLLPATVHTTQNVGDTELLGVLVELKY